jgi:hypothetical protein
MSQMMEREMIRPLFAKYIYMYLIDTFIYVKMVNSNLIPAKFLFLHVVIANYGRSS